VIVNYAANNANSLGHISAALRLWRMPQALHRSNVPVICGVSHRKKSYKTSWIKI